ncbi:putative F-box protein At3g21120 isoform X2 [Silene latifolia]|uniref:putative F-box protein At3g21120 isoform X2 n=1 Tax=Silene latifolia TaxID=37657 RepID=UPI003D786CB8
MERNYGKHRNSTFGDPGILPEDILIDILLRVAARHLARLRFVCKSWRSLIDDVNFIERHYGVHYSICKADGDNSFLCDRVQYNDLSFVLKVSLVSEHTGDVPLDLTPNLLVDSAACFTDTPNVFSEANVVGVVKGVVCIFWWQYQDLGLWNPATREFKALTPWLNCLIQNQTLEMIGFGFDCISNDFKTLRGNLYQDGTPYYELNSLKTNSWKRVREPPPLRGMISYIMGAYLNGVAYWYVYAVDSPVASILSFNFHTEVFELCNLPADTAIVRRKFPFVYKEVLAVYKERLAFVLEGTDIDMGEFYFHVWTVTPQVDANSGTRF